MKTRKIEVKNRDGWVEVDGIKYVKRGQMFRLFEPTGEKVIQKGSDIFYAMSEPYWSYQFDTWLVDASAKPVH